MDVQHDNCILGIRIEFPNRPYPTQLAMMQHVVNALNLHQNALLESPTGTGKTLALLCSSLAWQEHDTLERRRMVATESPAIEEALPGWPEEECESEERMDLPALIAKQDEPRTAHDDDEDAEFQNIAKFVAPRMKRAREKSAVTPKNERKHIDIAYQSEPVQRPSSGKKLRPSESDRPHPHDQHLLEMPSEPLPASSKRQKRVAPFRIYYGTRTHAQISQVLRELKKTSYRPVMAVLGSRKHYCIHRNVSRSMNPDAECLKLLDTKKPCAYNRQVDALARHPDLFPGGYNEVWDIEDLVKLGKDNNACPFFASRNISKKAQIVFCPYQYLLDESIRKSVGIDLRNAVAHNIEDACRDSTSLDMNLNDFKLALEELNSWKAKAEDQPVRQLDPMISTLKEILDWIVNNCDSLQQPSAGKGGASKFWTGEFLVGLIRLILKDNVDMTNWEKVNSEVEKGWESMKSADGQPQEKLVSATSQRLTKKLWYIVGILLNYDIVYAKDYRLVIEKTYSAFEKEWIVQVGLWCLTPAAGFRYISENARSVILTSGTLAPFDSFTKELGTRFHHVMEADHVILAHQLRANVISREKEKVYKITHQTADSSAMQDSIGQTVLRLCQVIPHGVLCFFASYHVMEKMLGRWVASGLSKNLLNLKLIFQEPKTSGGEFVHVKDQYELAAKSPRGVCRGKFSEGLDIGDFSSRGVIVIGLPYPSFVDKKVTLKIEHNDNLFKLQQQKMQAPRMVGDEQRRTDEAFLSGQEWYELQCFRAINQAIGRCIRHRNDFGMIALIDYRFSEKQKQSKLSKWVRSVLYNCSDVQSCVDVAAKFFFSNMPTNVAQTIGNATDSSRASMNNNNGVAMNSGPLKLESNISALKKAPLGLVLKKPNLVSAMNNSNSVVVKSVPDAKIGPIAVPSLEDFYGILDSGGPSNSLAICFENHRKKRSFSLELEKKDETIIGSKIGAASPVETMEIVKRSETDPIRDEMKRVDTKELERSNRKEKHKPRPHLEPKKQSAPRLIGTKQSIQNEILSEVRNNNIGGNSGKTSAVLFQENLSCRKVFLMDIENEITNG